jgi:cytochrome c-type protein NapB
MKPVLIACAAALLVSHGAFAADLVDALRGNTAVLDEPPPPDLPKVEDTDQRRMRNYAMQPPTIPHRIDGYQVDLNTNKCMSCHRRGQTEDSKAPMVSVTHYMDRDGNFLAEISPRRYFCEQCHVPQFQVKPLVDNRFEDIEGILERKREQNRGQDTNKR